ncbi:MAG TPA: TetR/AcrR family transcriptional regulator [Actinomycetota bacterium]
MTTTSSAQPVPSPRRVRARRGEGERLRDEILAAAARLLIETGDESAVSIRAVAAAVGVTPPSIYLHFGDKNELLRAVCSEQFRQLAERNEAAAASTDDPVEALRRCGRAYVAFGLENPEAYRILLMCHDREGPERAQPEAVANAAAFFDLVQRVQRAIDAGALGPVDPVQAALGLWATAHGLTSLLIAHPAFPWPQDRAQLIDRILDQALTGLLAG